MMFGFDTVIVQERASAGVLYGHCTVTVLHNNHIIWWNRRTFNIVQNKNPLCLSGLGRRVVLSPSLSNLTLDNFLAVEAFIERYQAEIKTMGLPPLP